MDNSYKTAMKYIIIFSIVIVIGLVSVTSMLIYSLKDKGVPADEAIQLEECTVQLYKSVGGNYLKFEFFNVVEESSKQYTVSLMDSKGNVLDTMLITVDLRYENMDDYIYEAKVDIHKISFYDIKPMK